MMQREGTLLNRKQSVNSSNATGQVASGENSFQQSRFTNRFSRRKAILKNQIKELHDRQGTTGLLQGEDEMVKQLLRDQDVDLKDKVRLLDQMAVNKTSDFDGVFNRKNEKIKNILYRFIESLKQSVETRKHAADEIIKFANLEQVRQVYTDARNKNTKPQNKQTDLTHRCELVDASEFFRKTGRKFRPRRMAFAAVSVLPQPTVSAPVLRTKPSLDTSSKLTLDPKARPSKHLRQSTTLSRMPTQALPPLAGHLQGRKSKRLSSKILDESILRGSEASASKPKNPEDELFLTLRHPQHSTSITPAQSATESRRYRKGVGMSFGVKPIKSSVRPASRRA